jgi:hypothetical protein
MKRENCIVTERKADMTINYGIIAYTLKGEKESPTLSILHFCGYAEPPTQADIESLSKELNTDPEFGLVGKIGTETFLMEATPDIIKKFKELPPV